MGELTAKWAKWSGGVETLRLAAWPEFTGSHVIFRLTDGRVLVELSSNVVRLEFPAPPEGAP